MFMENGRTDPGWPPLSRLRQDNRRRHRPQPPTVAAPPILRFYSSYETFNGKKWEKFNSEKVASLAYARIKGRGAFVAHF